MSGTKKLRVFAGPNGSGKTTIKEKIDDLFKLGVYVNADEMKKDAERDLFLDFDCYNVELSLPDLFRYVIEHPLYEKCKIHDIKDAFIAEGNRLVFLDRRVISGYLILILADYIRALLLSTSDRFSFETVLSDPSKLVFMKQAKEEGFKIYLYFVSLAAPEMNVERVRSRVQQGGHDVPPEKITDRYYRTMSQLFDAMRIADSVYLFDNSYQGPVLFAKKENGILERVGDKQYAPKWYQDYVLDKLPKNV